MSAPVKRFQIALSFPGEHRDFVRQVADVLAGTVGTERILYDKYYEAEMARRDLDTYLQRLYYEESELVVVFLCAEYERKEWCRLEWRAVRNILWKRDNADVMLLRFDQTEIPGLFPSDGYVEISDRAPADVAGLILDRLALRRSKAGRVHFVSSEYLPHVLGGLGTYVVKLTTALAAHMDVKVLLPSSDTRYQTLRPEVELAPLADIDASYDDPISWLHFGNAVAAKLSRAGGSDRPEILHCHDWVTGLAGVKARWKLEVPLVFHLHCPNRTPLCASIENLVMVCADLVTVSSEAMAEELMARHLPIRRVEVVENGVDTNEFYPCEDWPADDGYILFVGRLVEQKGVDFLLRAFRHLKPQVPDLRLKIVGDGQFRSLLERLSKNLMIAEQVDFLGWQTGPELLDLYQKAQVVAVPSIYEPFGITALEGMACRRPVVASRVGGLKEIIEHEVSGLLAEPKDPLSLAQWLMTLATQPALREGLGTKGLERARGYSWTKIGERFTELYRSLPRTSLDLQVPAAARDYRRRIEAEAVRLSPALGQRSNTLLARLFDWM